MVAKDVIMKVEVIANSVVIVKNGIGIRILLKKRIIIPLDMGITVIFINERLDLSAGLAVASGDATAVAVASAKLVEFKNCHIQKLV